MALAVQLEVGIVKAISVDKDPTYFLYDVWPLLFGPPS